MLVVETVTWFNSPVMDAAFVTFSHRVVAKLTFCCSWNPVALVGHVRIRAIWLNAPKWHQQLSRNSGRSAKLFMSMEKPWAPKTSVHVTMTCVIIEVELAGIRMGSLEVNVEESRLRLNGRRDDDAPFETVIEVPLNYELTEGQPQFQNGLLRIIVPPKQNSPKGGASDRFSKN
jgi:HSP20 family molecular chaperone IbpA